MEFSGAIRKIRKGLNAIIALWKKEISQSKKNGLKQKSTLIGQSGL